MPNLDHRNISRYWSDQGLAGLSLLQADFTTHEYAPHSHDDFVIAITEAGGAIVKSGRETVEARPGVLFISNPAEPQSARMGRSERWRYRAFYVSDPALSQLTRHLGIAHAPGFLRSACRDSKLCGTFLSLHRALTDGSDHFKEVELVTTAFGALFARYGVRQGAVREVPADRRHLGQVLDLLQQRFRDSVELAELAEVAGLSIFQLIGLFRRVTGLTPHAYLIQLRLDAARHQLRRGASLADAAVSNGFYDQSALTKHFKRAYGITPGQFAAAVRPARVPACAANH